MNPKTVPFVPSTTDGLPAAEPSDAGARKFTRFIAPTERILLGAMFVVFGLNGFLNFIPPPSTPPPEGAMALAGAMMKAGYMFPLIKGTEVLAGALLLANRFVALALVILAPVVVNIVAFHVFLAPTGTVMAFVIAALLLHLAWAYRAAYKPLLAARITPA